MLRKMYNFQNDTLSFVSWSFTLRTRNNCSLFFLSGKKILYAFITWLFCECVYEGNLTFIFFFFFLFNSYFLNLHFLLLNIPIRTDLAQVISLFCYGQLLESSSWFLGCPSEFLSSNPKLTMAVLNFEVWSGSGSPFPNSQDPSCCCCC